MFRHPSMGLKAKYTAARQSRRPSDMAPPAAHGPGKHNRAEPTQTLALPSPFLSLSPLSVAAPSSSSSSPPLTQTLISSSPANRGSGRAGAGNGGQGGQPDLRGRPLVPHRRAQARGRLPPLRQGRRYPGTGPSPRPFRAIRSACFRLLFFISWVCMYSC